MRGAMKRAISIATGFTAVVLATCGEAVSIDPAERDAEDARREVASDADVADIVADRDAADEAYARDRNEKAAAAEISSQEMKD